MSLSEDINLRDSKLFDKLMLEPTKIDSKLGKPEIQHHQVYNGCYKNGEYRIQTYLSSDFFPQ